MALLVWRSGSIPRFLGGWLVASGLAYLANGFTGLLLPQALPTVATLTFRVLFGEMALMLWLVTTGVRPRPLAEPAPTR